MTNYFFGENIYIRHSDKLTVEELRKYDINPENYIPLLENQAGWENGKKVVNGIDYKVIINPITHPGVWAVQLDKNGKFIKNKKGVKIKA